MPLFYLRLFLYSIQVPLRYISLFFYFEVLMQYFCNLNAVNTLAQINIKRSKFIECTYTLLRKTIFYAVVILSVIASTFGHAMNSDQGESKSSDQRAELKITIPLTRRGSDSQLLVPRDKPRSNSRTLSPTTPANIDSNEISTGKIMLEQSEHLKNVLEKRLSSDKLKYDAIENSIDFSHEDSFDSNVSLVLGGERYSSYSDYFSHLDNITKEIGEYNKEIREEDSHSMPVFYDANQDNESVTELITLTKNSGRPTIIRGLATAEKDEDAVSFGLFNEILDTKIEAIQRFTSEIFTQNLNQVNHLSSKLDSLFEINDPTQIGRSIPPLSLGRSSHAIGSGATAFGVRALASGAGTTTFGSGSQAARDQASSFGHEAIAKGFNSLALGWQSISDRANTVSVGGPNNLRQMTHVQDGEYPTDAVNVRQLDEKLMGAEERMGSYNYNNIKKSYEDWSNKFNSLQNDVDKLIPIDDKLTKIDRKIKKQELESLNQKDRVDALIYFKDENSDALSKLRGYLLKNNNIINNNFDYKAPNNSEKIIGNNKRSFNVSYHKKLDDTTTSISLFPEEKSGVILRNIAPGKFDNDAVTISQLNDQSQKFDNHITKNYSQVHAEINQFYTELDNFSQGLTSVEADIGNVKNSIAQISLDLTGAPNLQSYVNERLDSYVDNYVDSQDFEDRLSTSPVLSHMSRSKQSPHPSSIGVELLTKYARDCNSLGETSNTLFSSTSNNHRANQKTHFSPIKRSMIFERRKNKRGMYHNEGNSSDSSATTNKPSTSISNRQNTVSRKTFNLLAKDVKNLYHIVDSLSQIEPPLHKFLESTINSMTQATEITEMLLHSSNLTSDSDNISYSLSDSDTDTNYTTISDSSPRNRSKRKGYSSNLVPIRENSSEALAGIFQINNVVAGNQATTDAKENIETNVAIVASATTGAQESIATKVVTVANATADAQENIATNVATVANATTDAQESIASKVATVASAITDAQENIATKVVTVASATTDAQENIAANVATVASATTDAQESIATDVTTIGNAATGAQYKITTNVETVASATTDAQESIATDVTTIGNAATGAQYKITTNVETVASATTDAQESIATDVTTIGNAATDAQENIATNVVTVASATADAQESIATDVTTIGNAATDAQENIATNVVTVASATTDAQENIATNVATVANATTDAQENIATNVAIVANATTDAQENIATNVATVANATTDAQENIAANVVTVANATTDAQENIAANVVTVASATTDAQENIAANVVTVASATADAQENIATNVATVANATTDAQENIATNVATVANATTDAQENIAANVVTVANATTDAQENIAANVVTVASATTDAQENIAANVVTVASATADAQENIATNVATVANATTDAQENIATNVATVASDAADAQENIATNVATVANATIGAKENIANKTADFMRAATAAEQNITANEDKCVALGEKLDNIELRVNTIDANITTRSPFSEEHSNAVLYDNYKRNSVTLGGADSETPVKVSNVAPGEISEDSTDAVNGAQLFESINYSMAKSAQYTDQRFSEMGQNINDMRQSINNVANHAYSGVAAAMAMPSMGPARPGHTMVSVGTASFKGRKATGVGVTYRSRGGQVMINAAASKAGSDTGMRVQVGYEF
ncbi:YadA-like family protein [Mycoavidus sp. SF9855]|uniref:YadA-like family protein n=1 Tax=Mycoavidus sp. SF9855 TaxID=2968475 RepID=UPI00211C887A|nr:YadA-like family protein [Mycoavidus sp. SF9855]UUM22288.1 YadA-like family protein [Mycoavidus sp. SF9855]